MFSGNANYRFCISSWANKQTRPLEAYTACSCTCIWTKRTTYRLLIISPSYVKAHLLDDFSVLSFCSLLFSHDICWNVYYEKLWNECVLTIEQDHRGIYCSSVDGWWLIKFVIHELSLERYYLKAVIVKIIAAFL